MTLSAQTAQGARQASIRAVTGTALTYEGDWEALFTLAGVPAGDFNGRMLAWVNLNLSASYTNINSALQALAVANGAANFSSLGTFSASVGPTAPIPSNYNMLTFGDSRPSGGLATSGVNGTSRLLKCATDCFPNIPSIDPRWAIAADVDPGGGTIIQGNFGFSGQTPDNYVVNPRAGNAAMTYTYAALHPAAVIILFGALNAFKSGGSTTTTAYTNMLFLINYWTNPANCGGIQKIVVLPDETPIGINLAGSNVNGMSDANGALMRTYTGQIRALDYRQAGGNAHVIVAPVYETILDPASAAHLWNYRGLSFDGTHESTASSLLIAQALVDAMAPSATAAGFTDLVSPKLASATNTNYIGVGSATTDLQGNPRMLGTAGYLSGVTLTSGTLPDGWWLQIGNGGTVSCVATTSTNAYGEIEYALALTWSGTSNTPLFFHNRVSKTNLLAKIATGDRMQAAARIKVDTGSVNFQSAGLRLLVNSTVSANNYSSYNSPDGLGAINTALYAGSSGYDGGGKSLVVQTPPVETSQVTNAGGDYAASNAADIQIYLMLGDGAGSATVRISQPTIWKI